MTLQIYTTDDTTDEKIYTTDTLLMTRSEDRMYWASSKRNPGVFVVYSSSCVRSWVRQGTGVLLPSLQPMQASAAVFGDFRDESGALFPRSSASLLVSSTKMRDGCQI